MARSLTVQPEENVSTSPLLTGFLIFAVACLLLAGVFGAAPSDPPGPLNAHAIE